MEQLFFSPVNATLMTAVLLAVVATTMWATMAVRDRQRERRGHHPDDRRTGDHRMQCRGIMQDRSLLAIVFALAAFMIAYAAVSLSELQLLDQLLIAAVFALGATVLASAWHTTRWGFKGNRGRRPGE